MKKVMITGACGAIGQSLAYNYIREGAVLILTDMEEKRNELEYLSEGLKKDGGTVYSYFMDNTRPSEIDETVMKIVSECGEIDILINNAGINRLALAENIIEEEWDLIVDTNLKGTF